MVTKIFASNSNALAGKDGSLGILELGTKVEGDGVTTLPAGKYIIASKATVSSVFDALSTSGTANSASFVEVGHEIYSDGTLVPETGDDVYPITETVFCDIQAWSLDNTKDEFESTTFCDAKQGQKVYIAGLSDTSGTISGVYKINITDAPNGFLRKFYDIIARAEDGSTNDLYPLNDSPLIVRLYDYKNENDAVVQESYILAPVTLLSFNKGANVNEATAFEASIRITSSEFVKAAQYLIGDVQ